MVSIKQYMWVLCEAIAQKVGISKIDVYREHIKAVGVYRQAEICDDAVKTLMHSWSLNGTGWLSEKVDCSIHEGFTVVNLYYGSSTYNTKQMSRLLDNVIQDCKDLEIETMTPQQIALLKEEWR